MYHIREFVIGDEKEIYQLFYDTVHCINKKDYTEEQLDIWAPKFPDWDRWKKTLNDNYTYVAIHEENKQIVGFLDMEKNGYLNRGYVHKDYQGLGIFKMLIRAMEDKARAVGIKKLHTDVSITAKPVMEQLGYDVENEQIKDLGGVRFINYLMMKTL
jgi:GNAT superfamily N-acetyltransferase